MGKLRNKKVDLNNLILFERGVNKGNIDWKRSIGKIINFEYDGVIGQITIIDSCGKMAKIMYDDKVFELKKDAIIKCELGKMLKIITGEFRLNVGDVIQDDNRNLTIIDSIINNKVKYYCCICNTCSHTWKASEHNLLREINPSGCPRCAGRIAILGINTIWDTDRWMCDLGVSEEDAKSNLSQSNKKVEVVCPDCGKKRNVKICKIYNSKSISCSCGDGRSYISKYITSVLDQLNIEYQTEIKYDWNKYINPLTNKESQASIDFVIYKDNREIPLEADGEFHRQDNKMNGMTKEQSKYIDRQRDKNCLKYLGENTIRISNEGDIKDNILNSELNNVIDLSKVNWNKCEEFALKNIVKEVCDYWNNKEHYEKASHLGKMFGLDRHTVRNYLKKGTKLGWCKYDPSVENLKGKKVAIYQYEKKLRIYESISELSRCSKIDFGVDFKIPSISRACKDNKEYKGYMFRYI